MGGDVPGLIGRVVVVVVSLMARYVPRAPLLTESRLQLSLTVQYEPTVY